MSSPDLDTLRQRTREQQEDFARSVDHILDEIKAYARLVGPAVGGISPGEALESLQDVTMKAFARCLENRYR